HLQGRGRQDQRGDVALDAPRHEDLRPEPLRALRDGLHLLRGRASQRRLEERAAPAHQAGKQARGEDHRRRRRAAHRRGRPGARHLMKTGAKGMPNDSGDSGGSTTGPQSALSASGTYATLAGQPVPTINTKPLFKLMVEKKASDLFFTSNAPIKIKIEGVIFPVNKQVLSPETVRQTALALMTTEQREHFLREWEIDFAISEPGLGRFRVNVFMQRGYPALVMRYITADMPRLDSVGLPEVMRDLIMMKRGLVMMVGATGSGKSTSIAAMINYRNENSSDHIVTIEDPIEFLHTNKRSIVNQREVGLDTKSYSRALR